MAFSDINSEDPLFGQHGIRLFVGVERLIFARVPIISAA
jgi:hypothetical protein